MITCPSKEVENLQFTNIKVVLDDIEKPFFGKIRCRASGPVFGRGRETAAFEFSSNYSHTIKNAVEYSLGRSKNRKVASSTWDLAKRRQEL